MEWCLLHLMTKSILVVLSSLSIVVWRLNLVKSLKRILVSWANVLNLGICDESFLWLFALFIEDTEVVPYFWNKSVQGSGLDDILKGVTEISILVIDNCQ